MSVRELLSRRLVLVTGKGGVGKSTCALALAQLAAREGKRVLLVESGEQSTAGPLLQSSVRIGHTPLRPLPDELPGLLVAHLDAQRCLQEYLLEHLKAERLVKMATENRVLARLWAAAPSVNEMAFLNVVYQRERALRGGGGPEFDLLVVDMPATGHAFAMLGVPDGVIALVRLGALAQRAQQIRDLLHDRQRTALCVVTLPEELPVNESVDLVAKLRHQLGLDASHVLINAVLPDPFEPDERDLMGRLGSRLKQGPGKQLADVVTWCDRLRQRQMQRIAELRANVSASFVEIGYVRDSGRARVDAVAASLSAAGCSEISRCGPCACPLPSAI